MKTENSENFTIPVFPLPGVVLFPGMNLPLFIFENKYKDMISECLKKNKKFGVVFTVGNTCAEVGTIAEIVDVENLKEGKMNLLTEGKERFKILDFVSEDPYYIVTAEYYKDKNERVTDKLNKTLSEIKVLAEKALKIFDDVTDQKLAKKITLPEAPDELLFLVASNLSCSFEIKQSLLESCSMRERTKKILALLKKEIKRLELLLENKKTRDIVETNGKIPI